MLQFWPTSNGTHVVHVDASRNVRCVNILPTRQASLHTQISDAEAAALYCFQRRHQFLAMRRLTRQWLGLLRMLRRLRDSHPIR